MSKFFIKMKSILLGAFAFFVLVSCKKDANKEAVNSETEVKANTFDVVFDLIIKQDDELILFYKDASIAYFDDKNTVYVGVKGSNQSQRITFSIPEGVYPNDIRFDISSNKTQAPIVINGLDLIFEGRIFHIDKKDFDKYFKPNEYMKYDPTTATATMSMIDDKYDPFFNTKETIYKELEKVLAQRL